MTQPKKGRTPAYKDPDPVTVPRGSNRDPTRSFERNQPPRLTLRATDQETARVVAIHRHDGNIVGAGCLVDHRRILTCRHVVEAALGRALTKDASDEAYVRASLVGVTHQPTVDARVGEYRVGGPRDDLASLEIIEARGLVVIPTVQFASPLRHGGKRFSVLGFPGGDPQGRNAIGRLHAADARGLVQMDRGGALSVLGGFSGAPVWSPDLAAFVGLVVTELANDGVAWCIPSSRLCEFLTDLPVRFRVPPEDRPVVNDWEEDDPNVQLFGISSDSGTRQLTAVVREYEKYYKVNVYYDCIPSDPPTGRYVTFITYPDFERDGEDAYELFGEFTRRRDGRARATQEFCAADLFTVAAIGDGGRTVLTFNLEDAPRGATETPSKSKQSERRR